MASPLRIVTLPPNIVPFFHELEGRDRTSWFATHDPDRPLGSGGGTAHALLAAWRAQESSDSFSAWLADNRITLVHAGGQSRRLPAYAAVGKALMPVPVVRGSQGQRPDQALIDLQVEFSEELLNRTPGDGRVLVMSGDVLLRLHHFPTTLPDADIIALGMRADAETVRNHGAFFIAHGPHHELDFMLQKPEPSVIRAFATTHDCLLDVGVWLLSERAVMALLHATGVENPDLVSEPRDYDLYSDFGPALGRNPHRPQPEIAGLTTAIVPVIGDFLHFGTSRQLVESVTHLHDQAHHAAPLGFLSTARRHPDQHVQNARFDGPPPFLSHQPYWVENAHVPAGWQLDGENVITGVPENTWSLHVPNGVCLDFAPVEEGWCIRFYGYDDAFKGRVGDAGTHLFGAPFTDWLQDRKLTLEDLGLSGDEDLQNAPIFPIVDSPECEALVNWCLRDPFDPVCRNTYLAGPKCSASELLSAVQPSRVYDQRRRFLARSLSTMQSNHRTSVFYSLDLERASAILEQQYPGYVPNPIAADEALAKKMHDAMFRSAILRLRGDARWEDAEAEAFGKLKDAILGSLPPAETPHLGVATDQIVWGRSPLRFDLAGGWTDTPPYCLLHGGRVLNVAVDLNGQPPVQVFVRRSDQRNILLRSIDLGTERRYETFEDLSVEVTERSEFALAQAALHLAGFQSSPSNPSLPRLLDEFGGGIEMSLLAAVPKGSGLGTSSILAATILAALNEFCCLGWNSSDVLARTLALEQMLGTGGGWQDQAGGCLPGLKDLQTQPGLLQSPTARWLPERLLGPEYANHTALLYYTGITRVAKSVLREIVRGMFLNSGSRLATLEKIRGNVGPATDAIQRHDWDALGRAVGRSWELNQELDSGTNPPAVQAILAQVEDYLLGAKLLGAGGGGFIFMMAKDPEAARRIRETLEANPPSARARFFDFRVSAVGLEVTKS